MGEKGEVWAKHMGLKQGASGNTLGNTLGTYGTYWELKGTIGNKGKMKKNDTHPCSLGTKDRRTWYIHTNIRPRVYLSSSCGFRV
jgi:hypothetical protein